MLGPTYSLCQWRSNLLFRLGNAKLHTNPWQSHGPLAACGIYFFLFQCNNINLTKLRLDLRNAYSIALTLCPKIEV